MNKKTTPAETQTGRHLDSVPTTGATEDVDLSVARRRALRTRHAHNLTRLMDQREDLRGVHSLADFVDDSVRWTA